MFLLKKNKLTLSAVLKSYLENKKLFSLDKSHNTNQLKIL